MSINSQEKQRLRGKAHSLKPIVAIGRNGLTPAVLVEVERGLIDHKLMKIRISLENGDSRRQLIAEVCAACQAELIQVVGKICVIYRATP